MKILSCTILALLLLVTLPAPAQVTEGGNIELGAGYAYATGNQGLSGFNAEGAMWFTSRAALSFDYDGGYDTSNIGTFQVARTGAVISKNHLQNFLLGPRISFPKLIKSKNKDVSLINPFVEVQLGSSRLNSEVVQEVTNTRLGTHDTGFTWMFGGGGHFRLSPHWDARGNLDFLRTHFSDAGQSRLRFVLGLSFFVKARPK